MGYTQTLKQSLPVNVSEQCTDTLLNRTAVLRLVRRISAADTKTTPVPHVAGIVSSGVSQAPACSCTDLSYSTRHNMSSGVSHQ